MQFYIYLTTNLINGKQYIGQHKGKPNDDYFGSGTAITRAINKYGKENFQKEILCYCESQQEANEKEKYYIQKFDAINNKNFYNLAEGGQTGDGWRSYQRWRETHPDEAQKHDQKAYENLIKWKEEHPEQYYDLVIKPLLKGAQEWRENNPEQVITAIKKCNVAKKQWQQEHFEKWQVQVTSWREAGSIANSQKIICITTNEVFPSQCEASRHYNIPQANISKCLRGERKSAGKHPVTGEKMVWKRFEDVNEI